MNGRIELICGCMFAGKTARLIAALTAAQQAGQRVVAFQHATDTRYGRGHLATHDGLRFRAITVEGAGQVRDLGSAADVIGVDEAQFFGRRLVDAVVELAAGERRVIVVGLEHDVWGRPFPPVPQLKRLAASIEVLTAPCRVCGRPAHYSQLVHPPSDGSLIGGPEAFEPRCGTCFRPHGARPGQ